VTGDLPRLYAIVDPDGSRHSALALASAYLAAGAPLLQLRLKGAPARSVYETSLALRALTHAAGALLIVNDRPDVAAAVDADGVHLGQTDVPIAVARRVVGARRWIGVSTHDVTEAARALADGADYLGVGPIFATTSKLGALPARGLDLVRTIRETTTRPLVAIGGISADTARAVLDAGASSVAMIAALSKAPDPAAAVRHVLMTIA
jgi:thiamine-phosphate diphosphorylase